MKSDPSTDVLLYPPFSLPNFSVSKFKIPISLPSKIQKTII